ncbi:hypothetical protein RUM43_004159 [Polyplax serrata]|uniref:Methyltransferase-like protein 5 n=1 Tax=Polyplax serrata TaxID=468196 RepID=A0AAN8XPE7_POLSC
MKLKDVEQHLQDIRTFENPKVKLEQYATMPHICARMLHTIQSCYGDIEGKIVGDLGCGCGSLTIGSCLLNAQFCVGFDIDPDALTICRENIDYFDINNIDLIQCDIVHSPPINIRKFDTIIMNPPFGTKTKGLDIEFLKLALQLTDSVVYSLHKTSTRDYIMTKAKSLGVKAKVIAELNFDLPATYKFHKKTCVDIKVDFIRFSH